MEEIIKWIGIISPMALGATGSAIGCMIGGTALAGAMTRTKTGHGGLIAMSAAPSSQTIYGLVLMMGLSNAKNSAGAILALGLLSGIAIMFSAIMQGKCSAAGIRASVEDRSVYGKCWVPVGVTESFAVFMMVFALMMLK